MNNGSGLDFFNLMLRRLGFAKEAALDMGDVALAKDIARAVGENLITWADGEAMERAIAEGDPGREAAA